MMQKKSLTIMAILRNNLNHRAIKDEKPEIKKAFSERNITKSRC